VTDRWDTVHPRLDPDEAFDPTARVNAVAALCDAGTFLRDLRESPLIISRVFGPVCWRDVAIVSGDVKLVDQEAAPRFDPSTLNAAFKDADAESLREVTLALAQAKSRIVALEQFLTEKVGASHAPGFEPLTGLLGAMVKYLNQRLIERGMASEFAAAPLNGGTEAGAAAEASAPGLPARDGGAELGEIRGRDDVIRLLDRICAYYARFEPASPVPLLLERAKRLVPLGFADIVRDLAPDAMPSIEALRGPHNTNGSG
jgi:type VI secretion system protein ImpA